MDPQPLDIQQAIPHRPPMLLVEEVLELASTRIVCRKEVRADDFFLQGHYPDNPIVPGVILCEFAMQAGAILLSEQMGAGEGIPVATRMNDVKFKRMVSPGDTLEVEVILVERLASAFFLRGKISVAGQLAARLDFACTMAPPVASQN